MSHYADLLIAQGNAAAEAARQRRNVWADVFQNLSQLPAQVQQQQQRKELLNLEKAREQRLTATADLEAQTRLDTLEKMRRAQASEEAEKLQAANASPEDVQQWIKDRTGKLWTPAESAALLQRASQPDGHTRILSFLAPLRQPKPAEPFTLKPGEQRFSGTGGEPIASVPDVSPRPISVAPGGTVLDPKTLQPAFTAPQAPMTPYQSAELVLSRQRLALEQQKAAQTQADKTELTPEGLDAAALMFAKTGQLPALGMGDKTTRKQIINRAAALTPGLDVASAKADYGANTATLTQLEKQRAAIGAFEQTASKNIDIFLETAGKVVDTGSPLANTLLRQASGKLLGSADQATYDTARQVAVNEVAKIITNPNLAGQLSDAARKEVEAFNPANATLKQSVAVMRLLKRDMQNRTGALDDQIGAIRQRIQKGAP